MIAGWAGVSQIGTAVFGQDEIGRALMINLSKLKRDLGAALQIDWSTYPKINVQWPQEWDK